MSKIVKKAVSKSKSKPSVKMTKKTEEAVMTAEKVKLDPTTTDRIFDMLASEDKENHVVALAILDQCNVKEELPYLLLLYKRFGVKNEEEWKKEAPKLMKGFKAESIKLDTPNLTYKALLILADKRSDETAYQYITDTFAADCQKHLIGWGMDFLQDFDMKLFRKTAK